MKTTGRLALLGLFAATGVALAACVGISASTPSESQPATKPVALAAVVPTKDVSVPTMAQTVVNCPASPALVASELEAPMLVEVSGQRLLRRRGRDHAEGHDKPHRADHD